MNASSRRSSFVELPSFSLDVLDPHLGQHFSLLPNLRQDVLVAGVAGLVAGALSLAAGEYVSVSSQADTEQADRKRERHELAT